jgi:single-stranded DNA-binding protein
MPAVASSQNTLPCANNVHLIGVVSSAIHVDRSHGSDHVVFRLTTHERTTRHGRRIEDPQEHRCEVFAGHLDHFEASVHDGTVLEVVGRLTHGNGKSSVGSTVEVNAFRVVVGSAADGDGFR